jgi:archaellin
MSKKAMVGVSTLIIFISSVLTAAVAAAVLVRTVGIMQERSFAVTTEVRDRIVIGLDFISVSVYNNVTLNRGIGLEMMVQPRSGSYAYSLLTAGMSFSSEKIAESAILQHTENEDYDYEIDSVSDLDYIEILDLDSDLLDDYMAVVENMFGSYEGLRLNLTDGDCSYAEFNLGVDFSSSSKDIYLKDRPIICDSGSWLGFIQMNLTSSDGSATDLYLNATQNETNYFKITHFPVRDYCDYNVLIPETAFCYETRQGNGDTAVSKGEIYVLKYKLRSQNYLGPDEAYNIKMIPKKGDYTEVTGVTPDSFTRTQMQIWPIVLGD